MLGGGREGGKEIRREGTEREGRRGKVKGGDNIKKWEWKAHRVWSEGKNGGR